MKWKNRLQSSCPQKGIKNQTEPDFETLGLNAEACITSPTTRTVETTSNQTMNIGDPRIDVEQETVHYRGWSVALTFGQGIPNYIDAPSEQYDGIAHMICTALAEG